MELTSTWYLILAAILFANKRVFQLNQFYRQHKENRAPWTREAPEVGNYNKTIGIVGASHVGRLVIDYLGFDPDANWKVVAQKRNSSRLLERFSNPAEVEGHMDTIGRAEWLVE